MISKVVTDNDIRNCVALAKEIWIDHYTSLIGEAQVEYMLNKFQSFEAVKEQISEGFNYYLVDRSKGYFSYFPEGDSLFISKLYIHRDYRRQGLGKKAVNFIINKATGKNSLKLTVNRDNLNSVEVYKKLGFNISEEVDFDIGCSFYMNDYVMIKSLNRV